MMDGRVKTLHPKIHGGILALRDNPDARRQDERAWHPAHRSGGRQSLSVRSDGGARRGFEEIVENIDIGGPSMVRAAAKNHQHVGVVVDPGGLRFDSCRIEGE